MLPIKFINLARRKDRLENFQKEMKKHNIINYDRFNAIDGKTIELNDYINNLFKNNNFRWRRGIMGAILSHIAIWKELINSDYDYYLIFEDDIKLNKNFNKFFDDIKKIIFTNIYPFIFLGYHTHNPLFKHPFRINNNNNKINIIELIVKKNIWGGLFGYIIHKQFAIKLINDISQNGIIDPIDTYILKQYDLYTCVPSIVHSPFMTFDNLVDSDIQYDLLGLYDGYEFFSELDSPGYDIKWVNIVTIDQLLDAADKEPKCIAFNTYGFLKYDICYPENFIKLPGCNSKVHGIYIKKSFLEDKIKNKLS